MGELLNQHIDLDLNSGDQVPVGVPIALTRDVLNKAERKEALLVPSSIGDIQERLISEFGAVVPDEITQVVGLSQLNFVEIRCPNSFPVMFLGYEETGDVVDKSLNDATAVINIDRSDGNMWGEKDAKSFNNIVLPKGLQISGVNPETSRIFSIIYDGELNLGDINFSVSGEDGFTFQPNTRSRLAAVPYEYATDYRHGLVTQRMIERFGKISLKPHSNLVTLSLAPLDSDSYGGHFFATHLQRINSFLPDFFSNREDGVEITMPNEPKIFLPRKLPSSGQPISFFNT